LKASEQRYAEEILNNTFLLVSILTPYDEFYLVGQAFKYGTAAVKSVRFTKAFYEANKIKVASKYIDEFKDFKNVEKYVEFVDGGAGLV
ncbi:MAG: hypothetical protein ACK5IQ_07495, partial [Bacteroidales bacterium]